MTEKNGSPRQLANRIGMTCQYLTRVVSLLAALVMLLTIPLAASAHEVPQEGRKGSITLTMKYQGAAVPGGELTLYRVGEVSENDGNYDFVPTAEFSGCVTEFEDITSAALAKQLADYAKTDWAVAVKTADGNGRVKFEDLEQGLYLLVQTKAAEGYEGIAPFLVSVPQYVDGKYVYDVDAASKMETLQPEPEETTVPTSPPDDKLPQTGQLNWPVPVLICSGLLFLTLGWVLRFGKKKIK